MSICSCDNRSEEVWPNSQNTNQELHGVNSQAEVWEFVLYLFVKIVHVAQVLQVQQHRAHEPVVGTE